MNPMSDATTSSKAKRRAVWLTLLVVLIIGLIVVMTPIWIIQPFKAQTVRDLQVSFALRRMSPVLTIVASATFLLLAVWLWRHTRWFGKAVLVVLAIPLFAATWMARQNHFEWMFRPHASIAYAPPGDASFVNDGDMVAGRVVSTVASLPCEPRACVKAMNIESPEQLADFLAPNLNIDFAQKQALLDELDVEKRVHAVQQHISAQLEIAQIQQRLQKDVASQFSDAQRRAYLRSQLKAIQHANFRRHGSHKRRSNARRPGPCRHERSRRVPFRH